MRFRMFTAVCILLFSAPAVMNPLNGQTLAHQAEPGSETTTPVFQGQVPRNGISPSEIRKMAAVLAETRQFPVEYRMPQQPDTELDNGSQPAVNGHPNPFAVPGTPTDARFNQLPQPRQQMEHQSPVQNHASTTDPGRIRQVDPASQPAAASQQVAQQDLNRDPFGATRQDPFAVDRPIARPPVNKMPWDSSLGNLASGDPFATGAVSGRGQVESPGANQMVTQNAVDKPTPQLPPAAYQPGQQQSPASEVSFPGPFTAGQPISHPFNLQNQAIPNAAGVEQDPVIPLPPSANNMTVREKVTELQGTGNPETVQDREPPPLPGGVVPEGRPQSVDNIPVPAPYRAPVQSVSPVPTQRPPVPPAVQPQFPGQYAQPAPQQYYIPGLPQVVSPADRIQPPAVQTMPPSQFVRPRPVPAPTWPPVYNPNALYDHVVVETAPIESEPYATCADGFQTGWCAEGPFYLGVFGGFTSVEEMLRDFDQAALELDSGGGVGVAIGQLQGMNLRSELEFCFRGNDVLSFDGNAASGNLQTYAGMANLQWDFIRLSRGRFTPYVGAGIGFVFADPEVLSAANVLINDGSSSFAYQFMAGSSIWMSNGMEAFVEYRRFMADELDFHAKGQVASGAAGHYDYDANDVFFGMRLKF